MDIVRNIVMITLGLAAAYLFLTKSEETNRLISSLTKNYTNILLTARGEKPSMT